MGSLSSLATGKQRGWVRDLVRRQPGEQQPLLVGSSWARKRQAESETLNHGPSFWPSVDKMLPRSTRQELGQRWPSDHSLPKWDPRLAAPQRRDRLARWATARATVKVTLFHRELRLEEPRRSIRYPRWPRLNAPRAHPRPRARQGSPLDPPGKQTHRDERVTDNVLKIAPNGHGGPRLSPPSPPRQMLLNVVPQFCPASPHLLFTLLCGRARFEMIYGWERGRGGRPSEAGQAGAGVQAKNKSRHTGGFRAELPGRKGFATGYLTTVGCASGRAGSCRNAASRQRRENAPYMLRGKSAPSRCACGRAGLQGMRHIFRGLLSAHCTFSEIALPPPLPCRASAPLPRGGSDFGKPGRQPGKSSHTGHTAATVVAPQKPGRSLSCLVRLSFPPAFCPSSRRWRRRSSSLTVSPKHPTRLDRLQRCDPIAELQGG